MTKVDLAFQVDDKIDENHRMAARNTLLTKMIETRSEARDRKCAQWTSRGWVLSEGS